MNVFRFVDQRITNTVSRLPSYCLMRSDTLRRRGLCWLGACMLMFTAIAQADQNAAELPKLFEQLKAATSASHATELESRIWQHWLQAPDDTSEFLISQVSQAMGAGRLDLALELATQLVDGTPDYAEAWNKRATIYYLLGDNAASVSDIRETLTLEPRHFGAISGLGLIFMRERNLEAALEAFEQVLAISPESLNAKKSAERVRNELEREI